MSLRDIKRKARRDLHQAMLVPAFYIASTGATPVLVHVRVHTKFAPMGDMSGMSPGYAQTQEMTPRLIFMRDEMEPRRGAIVSVEPGEAYKIDNILPPDDITRTAIVSEITDPAVLAALPVPGSA